MTVELSDGDRVELTRLEECLWRVTPRTDPDCMQRALAADFLGFGRSGRACSREVARKMARAAVDAVLPLPDLRIRLIDADTARVTYDSVVTRNAAVERTRRSSIWSRARGGWVLRFHQANPIPPSRAALDRWHRIVRNRDARGLADLLADDVEFHSPVVHTPQRGRAVATTYLAAALGVLGNDSFRYVREVVGARDAVLEFETTIDGIVVNGVDLITWNADDRITAFKVMVRRLKAINLVLQKMAARLAGSG